MPRSVLPEIRSSSEVYGTTRGVRDLPDGIPVSGIAEVINNAGLVNVDFADVRTVMGEVGMAMMGSATAAGIDRARTAAQQAASGLAVTRDNPYMEAVHVLSAMLTLGACGGATGALLPAPAQPKDPLAGNYTAAGANGANPSLANTTRRSSSRSTMRCAGMFAASMASSAFGAVARIAMRLLAPLACTSSAMPGGQPSTTQPIAGP